MKRTFVRRFGRALLAAGVLLAIEQVGLAQGFYVHGGHYGGHYGGWGPPPRPYYPVMPVYPPAPYVVPAPVPYGPAYGPGYGPGYPGPGYQTGAALVGVADVLGALRHH